MSYNIVITKKAQKQIKSLPKFIANNVSKRISELANDPTPYDSKKLKADENAYRIRVGDYRVLYEIYKQELIIKVVRVAHRKDVYRL